MRPFRRLALLTALACAGVPPAHAGLSPREEVDLGREVARQIERTNRLSTDAAMQARVNRVGQAIVEQLKPRVVYPYQFKVIASPEVNAFALPGGFVYFHEGLINLTPDDDALAFVIAHEVSHAAHRHYSKMLDRVNVAGIIGGLLSLKLGVNVADLAMQFSSLSFSRQDENDADATAVDLIAQAGFDTAGAETVMQLFLDVGKKRPKLPRFMSTHPPPDHRLGRIKEKRKEIAARPPVVAPDASSLPQTDLAAIVGMLPTVALEANPWFPLAVGAEWTYQVQAGTGPKNSYTLSVPGRVAVGEGAVYRTQVVLGKVTTSQQWLTSAGEVWKRGRSGPAGGPWQVECLTEVAEGEEVERDGWRYTRLPAETVVTPCGNFTEVRGLRRVRVGGDEVVDTWFARGVGMVKRVQRRAGAGVTELLASYHLPKLPLAPPPAGATTGQTAP